MPLSNESSSCRIDWRPSPLLSAALVCLGALAATALWLSALPLACKLPLGLLALGHGGWLARREARRRVFSVEWNLDGSGVVMCLADRSLPLSAVRVNVRGPLASVSGRGLDGRTRRLLWFPDTLPVVSRRALRLQSGNQMVDSDPTLATMSG
ncbi:MAG: hypothetical protein WC213_07105 [Arenimonas sp.]|jgi:toxin CptA